MYIYIYTVCVDIFDTGSSRLYWDVYFSNRATLYSCYTWLHLITSEAIDVCLRNRKAEEGSRWLERIQDQWTAGPGILWGKIRISAGAAVRPQGIGQGLNRCTQC